MRNTTAEQSRLPSVVYKEDGKEKIIFTLPPTRAPERDSVLYFSMAKGGTRLLNGVMRCAGECVGLPRVFIQGALFNIGLLPEHYPEETRRSIASLFLEKGYCYGFSRPPIHFEVPLLGKTKSVLLVRDPRDILVSLYYSVRYSHPAPGTSENTIKSGTTEFPGRDRALSLDIDTYVTQGAEEFAARLRQYRLMMRAANFRLYRYEDVIYKKAEWVADICSYFDWAVPPAKQRNIVAQVDVFPEKERPDQHVRQVHPGNYKKKLKPETIRKLDEIFAEEMAFFGYKPYSPPLWERVKAWI